MFEDGEVLLVCCQKTVLQGFTICCSVFEEAEGLGNEICQPTEVQVLKLAQLNDLQ